MAMNLLRCVLLAAAAAALAGPTGASGQDVEEAPVAVPAPVTADASVAVEEARALMQERRYAEALEQLYPLAQGAEVNADIVFLIGLAAMERSQQPDVSAADREALLEEAIAAFRLMLVNRPDLVRVRLELARAFFLLRDDDLAREHFEEVLAGDPPASGRYQRPPVSRADSRAPPLEPARGHRPGSRHQHRRDVGRTDHLHRRPAVRAGRGRALDVGSRRLRVAERRVPVPAKRSQPAAGGG